MSQHETDDDGAARWAIRLDAGALCAEDAQELDRWLAGNARREGALLRAQAALSYLDRGRALADLAALTIDVGRPRIGRRALIWGAGTTGIAAALSAFLLIPRATVIDTQLGEVRQIPLGDGSVATLNTNSELRVAMADKQRTVRLAQGEAWFRVAHDKHRPFIVEAGDIRVCALGTAFSVRQRGDGLDVLVTEGTVEAWIVGHEAQKRKIAAGSRGFISDRQAQIEIAAAPQEIERALSWRSGELALDGEMLGYAVGEINRYNVRKIVVADASLSHEQLVGYFRTTEPENFAHAVAGMLNAKVVIEGETIRIEKTGP